ncbi:MAG: hypothetical protein JG772_704, partial [Dysgonamonadaceae bacterium]|nr:hypothetical protein [Dysgonamonadaceae bacterium]
MAYIQLLDSCFFYYFIIMPFLSTLSRIL